MLFCAGVLLGMNFTLLFTMLQGMNWGSVGSLGGSLERLLGFAGNPEASRRLQKLYVAYSCSEIMDFRCSGAAIGGLGIGFSAP